ncbi:hypothetical protein [Streptomyces violaceusniger]|uniref:Uncharacterized protein n=1 Tax=Streptomyces violaceusniger (strain Tu 4113) TaxID=653045 RepID=G2PHQ6_STRV4|nr:hypothetical protein [Streptomyces violaceusniger]AEM88857.1 hypothetical protein Strvi_0081 [Streptomyces violaceusniger Tu 4113]
MTDQSHGLKITREPQHKGFETLGDAANCGEDFYLLVDGSRIGGSYWCGAESVKDGERWASWGPAGLSMGHRTREDAEQAQVTAHVASGAPGVVKDAFHVLAEEITAEMGEGWALAPRVSARRSLRMVHRDGRAVDLWNSDDGRVTASGCFPVTDTSVKHQETSAAVSRGAVAIARQINGPRFMAAYAPEYARVSAHNERQERREAARREVRELLTQYIPEDKGRGTTWRPSISTRQAHENTGADNHSGWEYTDRVVVDLEFRDLTPEEARMIMRAYSITFGHTPGFLRPAA